MQLFLNIFDNAVKFQLPGNKPIVVVKAEAEAEHWRISISDNGIGIAAEHLEAIFAVFRRLHTQDEYPGTGIGLAICQKVAVHHGGSITAESAGLGQGACFVLRLPFHPSPAAGSA